MTAIIELSVTTDSIAPWRTLEKFEQQHFADSALLGACVTFSGKMRNHNDGQDVTSMKLEHYAGMTEKVIQKQIDNTLEKFPLAGCLVQHRIGEVVPGDTLVICACWSSHRHEAFRACEEIFEGLKSTAPFWKKETLVSGKQHWVTNNSKNPRR